MSGCATTAVQQPNLFESHPELLTKKYSPEEIALARNKFQTDPIQYSQGYGIILLWQMHRKCPEFAKEFARIPELNDGINPQEIKAMISIWNLIKNLKIPPDLFEPADKLIFKNRPAEGFSPELTVLRKMTLIGKGDQIYSALLQALLWGYMDGYFKEGDNPLRNFQGTMAFVKPIWGQMKGSRWENPEEVMGRLNTPELIDYYEKTQFSYEFYDSGNWVSGSFIPDPRPTFIFKKKRGNCVAYSTFTEACLKRDGYEAWLEVIETPYGEHATVLFKDKGKFYLLDNAYFPKRNSGIQGPFEYENEALQVYEKPR